MDISKLEIILRALELGSITKAANEYGYSTVAVSKMLNTIEKEIGIKIARRTYTGISIIEGKEEFISLFKKMVEYQNKLKKLAATQKLSQNIITIASYASISKHILSGAVKSFKLLYPDIELNIIISNSPAEYYKKGTIDIVFGGPINEPGCAWKKILTDPYVAVLPESYEGNSKLINRDELLAKPFIIADDSVIDEYIKEALVSAKGISTSDSDSSVVEFVRAGLSVSILSKLSVKDVDGIKIKMISPPLSRELGLSYDKEKYKTNKALKLFIDFLEKYMKNM